MKVLFYKTILIYLMLVGSIGCDMLDRHQTDELKQVQFRENAVYTYDYTAIIEDTIGTDVEYRFSAEYKVEVLKVEDQLEEAGGPLVLLKTYRSNPPGDTVGTEYSYDWYYQDEQRLTRVAYYEPGIVPQIRPKSRSGIEREKWMETWGLHMIRPSFMMDALLQKSTSDTMVYASPRTVMQYPVMIGQNAYKAKADSLYYRKSVVGREMVSGSNRSFNAYMIRNERLGRHHNSFQYTDYMAQIGLVKRTSRGMLSRVVPSDEASEGFIIRTETVLTGYRLK